MTAKVFEVNLDNILTYSNEDVSFIENTDTKLKINNAVIISMVWNPVNCWQKMLWFLLKHSFSRTHYEHFDIAKKFYKKE